jgi:SH3-like domain-containing protein
MKTNCWLILGMMIATGAIAQDTNMTPPADQPSATAAEPSPTTVDTNAPAAEPVKKVHHKKHRLTGGEETAMIETPVTLVPGPAEVAAKYVNVRGQASLRGEVIAHLTKGDSVTVIEQINLQRHKADEPSQWAKISFPTNANVWINSRFIDATNKTVLPKKLNLRDGPGENYSIVGLITHDTPVSEVSSKDDWTEIEPPTNAYAFVAAMYLKQETNAATAETNAPPAETNTVEQPTSPMPVAQPTPIVTEPTNAPAETNTATPVETNTAPPPVETNAPMPAPLVEPEAPPPPPRVVQHVGVVRHVVSIVAPTDYELYDPATGKNIDYLFTISTNLDLSRWNSQHVVVTGEEGLDARWKDTPVITIQRIQVAE